MKIDLLTKDGKPAGHVEVPDEVVSAANLVCTWLSGQVGTSGQIAALCGVTLYSPPLPLEPAMPLEKPLPPVVRDPTFWWKRDE